MKEKERKLEFLETKEIRKLAKKHGVLANQQRDEMIVELARVIGSVRPPQPQQGLYFSKISTNALSFYVT